MAYSINFSHVNQQALTHCPNLLPRLLPQGKYQGNEYIALNPTRDDRHLGSFKINTQSGRWADFACGDSGGDLISLVAYLFDLSQGQAARLLSRTIRGIL